MCDNRCQPAHFRIRKDCLIFPHSNDHNRPGAAPLRPEGASGSQSALHMHVLVCICSYVRQFHEIIGMMQMSEVADHPNLQKRQSIFSPKRTTLGKAF